MATITWTNGNGTGLWSDALNWSAGKPATNDDVVLDATSTANCVIDETTATLTSFTASAAYTGTITLNSGKGWNCKTFTLTGTTVVVTGSVTIIAGGSGWTQATGSLTGAGVINAYANTDIVSLPSGYSLAQLYLFEGTAPRANDYSGFTDTFVLNNQASNRTLTWQSGSYTFNKMTFQTQSTGTLTITGATNNPNIRINNNIVTTEGTGAITFITGTGTWDYYGSIDYSGVTTLTCTSGVTSNFRGVTKTFKTKSSGYMCGVKVKSSSSYTVSSSTFGNVQNMDIESGGAITISGTMVINNTGAGNGLDVKTGGALVGAGTLWLYQGGKITALSGTVSVTNFKTPGNTTGATLPALNYSGFGTTTFENDGTAERITTFASGAYIFSNLVARTVNTGKQTIDFSTNNPEISISQNLSCTKASTGQCKIIDGTGAKAISGNIDFDNLDEFIYALTTWNLNGSGKTVSVKTGVNFSSKININGTYSTGANKFLTISDLDIISGATLTITSLANFRILNTVSGGFKVLTGGTFVCTAGATTLLEGGKIGDLSGTVTCTDLYIGPGMTAVFPFDYSKITNTLIINADVAPASCVFASGTFTFNNFKIQDQNDGVLTVDMATNSPSIVVNGNFVSEISSTKVIFNFGSGTLAIAGNLDTSYVNSSSTFNITGEVLLNGTGAQSISSDSGYTIGGTLRISNPGRNINVYSGTRINSLSCAGINWIQDTAFECYIANIALMSNCNIRTSLAGATSVINCPGTVDIYNCRIQDIVASIPFTVYNSNNDGNNTDITFGYTEPVGDACLTGAGF